MQNLARGELLSSGGDYCAGDQFRFNCEDSLIGDIIMATLKPGGGGDGGNGGNGKEDRSRSMEFLLDTEKAAHLRVSQLKYLIDN